MWCCWNVTVLQGCNGMCCWNLTHSSVGMQWKSHVAFQLSFLTSFRFPTVLVHHINKSLCFLGFRMRKLWFCISICCFSLLSGLHPSHSVLLVCSRLSFTKGHFPKMAECAHFHYENVDFGNIQVSLGFLLST